MNNHHHAAHTNAKVVIKCLAAFCRSDNRHGHFNPSLLDMCIKDLIEARCHMAAGDVIEWHEKPRTATEVMQSMQRLRQLEAL